MDRDGALVAALGVAVLAGCTRDRSPAPLPSPSPSPSATPEDPDAALLSVWYASEQRLTRLAGGHPALHANHIERSRAVVDRLRVRFVPLPSVTLPARPASTAAALAKAEQAAATAYIAVLARVRDPDVAVLGAELAAGARQHAVVLAR